MKRIIQNICSIWVILSLKTGSTTTSAGMKNESSSLNANKNEKKSAAAVVTLVSGSNGGYNAGALALGQSLIDVGSTLQRICMVTDDVPLDMRQSLQSIWEVRQVPTIHCNHKQDASITADKYDLTNERYKAGVQRWSTTCTKFNAWSFTDFERVIFMDSDMLVVGEIDDALYGFSNASFVAAPESFPPDTFNSGFMVFTPSAATFAELLRLNDEIGSTEGGDQGVFNNAYCPNWFSTYTDDPRCGRLPWIFNTEVAYYDKYSTLRRMGGHRLPAVIHFVSDGKPWRVLVYEYIPNGYESIPAGTRDELKRQAEAHILWRRAFFKASNSTPAFAVLYRILTDGDKPLTDLSHGKDGEEDKKGDHGDVSTSSLSRKHSKVHEKTSNEKMSHRKVRTRNSKTNKRSSKSEKVSNEKPDSLVKKNRKRRRNHEL